MSGTFDYDKSDLNRIYDEGRKLPQSTALLWSNVFLELLEPELINRICDIDCGTGRFSFLLADLFDAHVYGLDQSQKMLSTAGLKRKSTRVDFLLCDAQAVCIKADSMDLFFMSMVYHHIVDKEKTLKEMRRVLRDHGNIAVRTSTQQNLETYLWLRFFPSALEIEQDRAPDRNEMPSFFESNGFKMKRHTLVNQVFAQNLDEYVKKIENRALSSLKAIPDFEFNSGMEKFKAWCRETANVSPVLEEIDFFLFETI